MELASCMPVVAGLAGPGGDIAVARGPSPRTSSVDMACTGARRKVGLSRARRPARRQQRPGPLGPVRLVPRLHGEQPAVADLDPDGGAGPVHGVDHRRQPQHPLPGVHPGHARAGATLLDQARVALDDQPDAGLGVGHERLGVALGAVVAVAGPLEHRRAVEPVAHQRRAADPQRLVDRPAHTGVDRTPGYSGESASTSLRRSVPSASLGASAVSAAISPWPSVSASVGSSSPFGSAARSAVSRAVSFSAGSGPSPTGSAVTSPASASDSAAGASASGAASAAGAASSASARGRGRLGGFVLGGELLVAGRDFGPGVGRALEAGPLRGGDLLEHGRLGRLRDVGSGDHSRLCGNRVGGDDRRREVEGVEAAHDVGDALGRVALLQVDGDHAAVDVDALDPAVGEEAPGELVGRAVPSHLGPGRVAARGPCP